jgi:shikimate kinase
MRAAPIRNRTERVRNGTEAVPYTRATNFTMNIALIGYRGTGKTTVAQQLALRLGWDWVDADVELELRAGKSIAAIFADDGEPAFRDVETIVLSDVIRRDRTVLALGGGVVLRPENRALLRPARENAVEKGSGTFSGARDVAETRLPEKVPDPFSTTIIWLTADPATIARRLESDASTNARRPNLIAGGLSEIRHLLAERMPLYRQCRDIEVDTENKSAAEVTAEILARLPLTQAAT